MSDTDEALVEEGAKAIYPPDGDWLDESEGMRQYYREIARAVLAAVGPKIAAKERGEALRYQAIAAEQGQKLMRQHIAFKLIREWMSEKGWCGEMAVIMRKWMDDGCNDPIPTPRSPFVLAWMAENGLSDCDGFIGYHVAAAIRHKESEG